MPKDENKSTVENPVQDIKSMSIYSRLVRMRVDLQNSGIKKTGENKYSNFKYYELSDFLPQCNQIALNYNCLLLYHLGKEEATLTLLNCDNTEESHVFSLPIAEVGISGASAMQKVGGLATYTRRYLYMIAFEISDNEMLDPNSKENKQEEPTPEQQKQIENIKNQKIAPAKVSMIRKKIIELCVPEEVICQRYNITAIEDATEEIFNRIWLGLKATEKQMKEAK